MKQYTSEKMRKLAYKVRNNECQPVNICGPSAGALDYAAERIEELEKALKQIMDDTSEQWVYATANNAIEGKKNDRSKRNSSNT